MMSNVPNIKILVACHKKCNVPSDPIYFPIHVGAEGKEPIGFTPDNTGENISTKNCMYSETTALYWAWKNLKCDYIGLVHYSRYLALRAKTSVALPDEALKGNEVRELLTKHKILLPRRRKYYIETIYSHYAHTRDRIHLDVTRKVITEMYPEYLSSFDKVMARRWAHMFNMFIMPKHLSDEYCSWLFPILEVVEASIDKSDMPQFQRRFVGAVSEVMLDVWLDHQIKTAGITHDDIYELPCIYTRKINWVRKIFGFLAAKLFHRKYTKSF